TPNGETTPMPVITTRGRAVCGISPPILMTPSGTDNPTDDEADCLARRRLVRRVADTHRVVVLCRQRTATSLCRLDAACHRHAAGDAVRRPSQPVRTRTGQTGAHLHSRTAASIIVCVGCQPVADPGAAALA